MYLCVEDIVLPLSMYLCVEDISFTSFYDLCVEDIGFTSFYVSVSSQVYVCQEGK